jgi:hypothetical protein
MTMKTTNKRKEISKKNQLQIITRDKLKCCCCNTSTPIKNITNRIHLHNGNFHHIIPMCYGGINDFINVCILCNKCHDQIHKGAEIKQKYFNHYEEFINTGKLTIKVLSYSNGR